jgi:DNA-binding winged helix-turn-helix (wHTH) protein
LIPWVRRPRLPVAGVATPVRWPRVGVSAMHYAFGDCVLDTQRYTLHQAGQPIRLRPKVFQVLVYLLTHRERVITKQELSDQVWKGQAISDATLERTLAAVRRALGDRGRAHRYIHTLYGYGYRFVAPVEERADPFPDAASEASLAVGEAPRASQRNAPPPAVMGKHVSSSPGENAADEPLASPAALSLAREQPLDVGERKLVTVLCCALSPTPGPREPADLDTLHQQVRALYNLAQHEAQRYGGSVQPVVGDRVLAVFGLPAAQEDHAQRAALAALGLQQRLQELPTAARGTPTPWPPVCMAVHTGPVAVGGLNDDDAAARAMVGETVTHVTALQDAAAPGAILCSAATARLVRELVRLEAVAPVALPSLPTAVYRILGRRSRRVLSGRRGGGPLSPFVGRHHELATLQALLGQAEGGQGKVVGIVGEPGLGKSRLLYEFRHSLRPRQLTYLASSCASYGQATPYLPMRELLRRHCGITADDSPATIRARVRQGLEEVGLDPGEEAPYLLRLLEVSGEPELTAMRSPEAIRARTIAILVQLTLQGARRRPLVLEVENLHWIDPSSEEVLSTLVERLAGAAILLLVTYRPGGTACPGWTNPTPRRWPCRRWPPPTAGGWRWRICARPRWRRLWCRLSW